MRAGGGAERVAAQHFRSLVRVLTVARLRPAVEQQRVERARRLVVCTQVRRDRRVVRADLLERGPRQVAADRAPIARVVVVTVATTTATATPRRQDRLELPRVRDHDHVLVVLRRGAQQARPTDVDHLDCLSERAARPAGRLLERIEIHDHQVDRLDVLLGELSHVFGIAAIGQQRGVDLWVQRP